MAKKTVKIVKKKSHTNMSREERVTGKPPVETAEGLDKDSREYRVRHKGE